MTDRIMGSETEWAILLVENGKLSTDNLSALYHIFADSIPSPPRLASSSRTEFYGNGARIYPGTNDHWEYSTPESMGATELVINEKAGERIVELAIARANEFPKLKEKNQMLRAFKNNKDGKNTYGAHENYCMMRKKLLDRKKLLGFDILFRLLAPYRISCKLFAGNGWLAEENGHLAYHLSQRAKEITEKLNQATTTVRAIINTRDRSYADDEKYFRLHLIDGDALIAEPALFLKFGTTSLVLDMIESGFLTGKPFGDGDDFLDALHDFSEDPTLRVAPNIGGKTYTIINIQEKYFNWANRFCETSGSTPEQRRALRWWEKIITLAKTPEPHLALAPFVDWAAKKLLMEQKLEKLGYNWSTPSATKLPKKIVSRAAKEKTILLPEQAAARDTKNLPNFFHVLKSIDFQFHENSPKGLARILEKKGFWERIVSDEDIEHALANPSPNTRALPRTLWNKKLLAENKDLSQIHIHWGQVLYDKNQVFKCLDPYDTDTRLHDNY